MLGKHTIPWNKGKTGCMPTPWNKGKTGIYSEETKAKMQDSYFKVGQIPWSKGKDRFDIRGDKHPMYGKHHSEETRKIISDKLKGRKRTSPVSEETREKLSQNRKGIKLSKAWRDALSRSHKGIKQTPEAIKKRTESRRGYCHSEETKAKISNAHIGKTKLGGKDHPMYGKPRPLETRKKISIARQNQRFPIKNTNAEISFKQICDKNNLPFKYTGDGSFWIGNINPDFIHINGKKIVVEIFGDYWHSPLLRPNMGYYQTYEGRKNKLKKFGWKLIVFWESDLKRVDAEKFILSELKRYKL